jgi:glycosyltransferase involved in cell wall biosynthesis
MHIGIIAHYYPPINSSGAKRAEALSKYFVLAGHDVTVITTTKSELDGDFTEMIPAGVNLIEIDGFGRDRKSWGISSKHEALYAEQPSLRRRFKNLVMSLLGQIPDPRLPFSISLVSPWLSPRAREAINNVDVVIGTTPPWPMVLAAVLCKFYFKKPCILDYRDHFSECHEMPGGKFAKWIERIIDRWLVRSADHVVCISEPMTSYYQRYVAQVTTILNGYDDVM